MERRIFAPDESWQTYIAKMLLLGRRISLEILDDRMDGSLDDLGRIQRVLDSNKVLAENAEELRALGILFGYVLIKQNSSYDWWVVEDEYGTTTCIRYKETTLLVFSEEIILNRVEDNEEMDILYIYSDLKINLERLIKEGYSNA